MTLQVISPSNIVLSEDCQELQHLGVQDLIWHGEPRYTKPTLCMPYSNANLIGYECCKVGAIERDLWGLGVVVLQVLTGTDVVEVIRDDV